MKNLLILFLFACYAIMPFYSVASNQNLVLQSSNIKIYNTQETKKVSKLAKFIKAIKENSKTKKILLGISLGFSLGTILSIAFFGYNPLTWVYVGISLITLLITLIIK